MTEPIEKPCTNIEYLSRMAERQGRFWSGIRKRLEKGEDFSILCPTLERAKKVMEGVRYLVIELNSKSVVKITHPFEKVADGRK